MQEILLGEIAVHVFDPIARIFAREKNIVEVDEDTFMEAGDDFEKFVLDVAADFEDVAGIDEENVVFLEGLEFGKGDVLDGPGDEARQTGETGLEDGIGVGFDSNEIAGVGAVVGLIASDGLGGKIGGVAGTDFDDLARAILADDGVEDVRVDVAVEAVGFVVGVRRGAGGLCVRNGFVFGAVAAGEKSEEGDLLFGVHANAGQLGGDGVDVARKLSGFRNGAIEMGGQELDAVVLSDAKDHLAELAGLPEKMVGHALKEILEKNGDEVGGEKGFGGEVGFVVGDAAKVAVEGGDEIGPEGVEVGSFAEAAAEELLDDIAIELAGGGEVPGRQGGGR